MQKKFILILLPLLAIPLLIDSVPTQIIKLRTFDALVPTYNESGNFVILNITEEDVRREGGYPLPRQRLAEIHVELLNKGAIGVGWTIAFPQKDRLGGDEVFAEALQYSPSVLAMFEDNSGSYPPTTGTIIKGNDIGGIQVSGVVQNLDVISMSADQGIATAPTEIDNLVRRIPLLYRTPDGWTPSFGTQIYKSLMGVKSYIISTNDNGIESISIRGIPPVSTDLNGRKWISWIDTTQTDLQEMNVEGKFVIIGVTAAGVMPQIATPVGLLEPHKIQAALAESILVPNSPYIPDYAIAVELAIFLLSIALLWLLVMNLGFMWGLASFLSIFSMTGFLGFQLIGRSLLIDVTWTMISQFITASTGFYLKFREQQKLKEQIKGQFGTYISKEYVDMIVKDPSLMKLGGDRRDLTFIFSDIVGFTPISEKYMQKDDPEGLVDLINGFLDKMTSVIMQNGGTLDKYVGDCIVAFWGAPIPEEDHAYLATKTLIELEILCDELNQEIKDKGLDLPPVMFGSGANTGTCIVGNMGSNMRMNYSVLGDSVNLAARLEAETRKQNTPIIISEYTYEKVKDRILCADLGVISVKGKEEKVGIYAPTFDGVVKKLYKD